jgi:hypothetical protein
VDRVSVADRAPVVDRVPVVDEVTVVDLVADEELVVAWAADEAQALEAVEVALWVAALE